MSLRRPSSSANLNRRVSPVTIVMMSYLFVCPGGIIMEASKAEAARYLLRLQFFFLVQIGNRLTICYFSGL